MCNEGGFINTAPANAASADHDFSEQSKEASDGKDAAKSRSAVHEIPYARVIQNPCCKNY